jgi:hypothetical protein
MDGMDGWMDGWIGPVLAGAAAGAMPPSCSRRRTRTRPRDSTICATRRLKSTRVARKSSLSLTARRRTPSCVRVPGPAHEGRHEVHGHLGGGHRLPSEDEGRDRHSHAGALCRWRGRVRGPSAGCLSDCRTRCIISDPVTLFSFLIIFF